MENKLPNVPKRTYQRSPAVTIAAEQADIIITGFLYRIWLETEKIYIEKTALTKEGFFHNDRKVEMDGASCEITWEEGDSFCFSQGTITVYQNELVVPV